MYGYIYKTANLITGTIYIGKKKSAIFLGEGYLGSGRILHQAVEKYGIENFSVELVEWCESLAQQNEREKFWINYYRSAGVRLYNIANGGDGGDTYSGRSEEQKALHRQRLSERQQARAPEQTQEIVTKRQNTMRRNKSHPGFPKGHEPWNKGKSKATDSRLARKAQVAVEYYIKNPGKRHQGRKHTPETIEKIRESLKGNKNGVGNKSTTGYKHMHKGCINTSVPPERFEDYLADGWVFGQYKRPHIRYNSSAVQCIETGVVYVSLSEASRELNISIYFIRKAVKTGQSVSGYHFKAIDQ